MIIGPIRFKSEFVPGISFDAVFDVVVDVVVLVVGGTSLSDCIRDVFEAFGRHYARTRVAPKCLLKITIATVTIEQFWFGDDLNLRSVVRRLTIDLFWSKN